ncbi:hypothetical protein AOLI_G00306540 [Acnodon oligacanthus]
MKSMCQWLIIGLSNTPPSPAELSLSSVPPQCQPRYGRVASLQERRQLKHLRQADETLPLKAAEKETAKVGRMLGILSGERNQMPLIWSPPRDEVS